MSVRPGRIYECQNAHFICQECHDKLVQPRKCPSCKEKLPDPPTRNVAIERMIDRCDGGDEILLISFNSQVKKREMALQTWGNIGNRNEHCI